SLPDDFAAYFRTIDGMDTAQSDQHEIRFWPLSEVRPLTTELNGATSQSAGLFVFADFLLWSHAYAIRLADGKANEIVIVGGDAPIRIADSFIEFLTAYCRQPELLFPKP